LKSNKVNKEIEYKSAKPMKLNSNSKAGLSEKIGTSITTNNKLQTINI